MFPKCFHLYDRALKPRVLHDERFTVPRISAVLELCIQAGVDLEKFPSKRRTKPVYSIEGRIVDFEEVVNNGDSETAVTTTPLQEDERCVSSAEEKSLKELSIETMDSWFEMVTGVKELMGRYKVWTCGYCPEIQVGPKGHKVKMCRATKHQMRDGMHAWQEATIDDVVGPNYVWHVRDPDDDSALDNSLQRFYGKAPAVVELCVQGGAPVPDQYKSMMRLDVVYPQRDEVDLVA